MKVDYERVRKPRTRLVTISSNVGGPGGVGVLHRHLLEGTVADLAKNSHQVYLYIMHREISIEPLKEITSRSERTSNFKESVG